MGNKTADELLRMKKVIEDKKVERSRLEGKRESLLQRLNDEYEAETLEEGLERLEVMTADRDRLAQDVDDLEKEIKETYEQLA